MARRNVMQRLTWCSGEQLEVIARNIGLDVAELPTGADAASRAKLLYDWATSIRGPGLLSLEAAIPWSVEPEMSRQFEVHKTAADGAGSRNTSNSEVRKPTIWEGSNFSETYTPQRSLEPTPDLAGATGSEGLAAMSLSHAGNEERELTHAPKPSPDEARPRVERPETPHGVPAYGARAEAASPENVEKQRSNNPDPPGTAKASSNKWWRNLLGKSGK